MPSSLRLLPFLLVAGLMATACDDTTVTAPDANGEPSGLQLQASPRLIEGDEPATVRSTPVLARSVAAAGGAVVLDFEEFTTTGNIGISYSAAGYTLRTTPNQPGGAQVCDDAAGSLSPLFAIASDWTEFYGGSVGILINTICNGGVALSRDDGGAFTLVSLDLAPTIFGPGSTTLVATHSDGTISSVGLTTGATQVYETFAVDLGDVVEVRWNQVGIPSFDVHTFDNLVMTDVDPTDRSDCFDGGWERYGFKNQGQCVRFVSNGKDSR